MLVCFVKLAEIVFSNKVRLKMKIFNMESQWERLYSSITFIFSKIYR